MYFRRELGLLRIVYWFAWPTILAVGLIQRGQPIWLGLLAGLAALLLFLPGYLLWYWQILPGSVVHRRFWNRLEFPFAEIDYVGPVTGSLARSGRLRHWIEVRNTSGRRMLVDAADTKGFLEAMRTHVPQVTLNP